MKHLVALFIIFLIATAPREEHRVRAFVDSEQRRFSTTEMEKYFSQPRGEKDASSGPSQAEVIMFMNQILRESPSSYKGPQGVERVEVDLQLMANGLLVLNHRHFADGIVQYFNVEEIYIRSAQPDLGGANGFPDEEDTSNPRRHDGVQLMMATNDKSYVRAYWHKAYEPWHCRDSSAAVFGLVLRPASVKTTQRLVHAFTYLYYRDFVEHPDANSIRNRVQRFEANSKCAVSPID